MIWMCVPHEIVAKRQRCIKKLIRTERKKRELSEEKKDEGRRAKGTEEIEPKKINPSTPNGDIFKSKQTCDKIFEPNKLRFLSHFIGILYLISLLAEAHEQCVYVCIVLGLFFFEHTFVLMLYSIL